MSAHASGASNVSTSSSPFLGTQYSSFFGTAVGNSNGASGASNPFGFGTVQYPAGSNTSPYFVQSSSSYPRFGVGATTVSPFCSSGNAASFASCGCTSASPFFANQSSGPFGTSVATNAGPFGQSSSRFTGFGDRTNASTSGQTSLSLGGFGEAATSTTPLFGHPGPSFNTFRRASFTTPASTLQPSIFPLGGGGPATADNSCGGTRAPYRPTPAEENLGHIVSISAMNCYCNKSHEELRSEEYRQTRNGGPFSAAHVPEVSSPLPSLFSWLPPPCEPPASPFNRSPENLSQWAVGYPTGTNTSPFVQSSSSFPGFGGATNTSPFGQTPSSFGGFGEAAKTSLFGQTPSSFGGFGEAAKTSPFGQTPSSFGGFGEATTSTTPLFGDTTSSFSTFRGEPLFRVRQPSSSCRGDAPSRTRPRIMQRPSNPFALGGRGPAITDNSCEGTHCVPYRPTPEENNLSWNNAGPVLTSISAMNCYCNKNHEELRLEDYKQIRNGGPSATNVSGISNPLPNPFSVSSTNPFQPANSSGWFPTSEPLAFAFKRSSENPFQRTGPSSAAHVPGVSNPLPNPFSVSSRSPFQPASTFEWLPPPRESLAFTFNRSSENPIQRTDSSSSLGSDKNRTTPVQTSPVQTSVAQTRPSPTPTTTTTVSNQTSNVNLNDLTLSITASGEVSFIPSLVNCIIPAFGAFEINGGRPLSSELGTPVLGFPVLIPTTLAFIPQYPQVSNPTSALPLHQPETHSIPRMILLNPTSSASTTNPANAHLSTIVETTSHVSPSAGVLGEQITNLSISAPPAPTNAAPSGSASPSDFNLPVTQHSCSIPKGLEIIVEHLGFNPWEGKNHLQDSQGGQIVLCEDASDDADILSLAEFAVEQHNAMEQFRDQPDGKVELLKVTAACLETVDGRRWYHIVLEAKKAVSSEICVYAVVLRKKTDRPTPLIVLERWLAQ